MTNRYARQILLNEVGEAGQRKLDRAKVLVLGAGGLGCPILTYLAAAGVGSLGIVDEDVVDESNLHRQVLYTMDDVGSSKVDAAARRLRQLNPLTKIIVHPTRITASNALELILPYDVIVDGTDNFSAKYLANDACFRLGKPLVYASISQFEGQLSVFNHTGASGIGPNYRDLFPGPPPPHFAPSCQEAGVLGVLPGILGCLQANEVLKIILGIGECLVGKLLCIDALTMSFRTYELSKREDNPLYRGSPHEVALNDVASAQYCGIEGADASVISPETFLEWRAANRPFLMLDVRNPNESAQSIDGSVCIPLSELPSSLEKLKGAANVVVYCQTGVRSRAAVSIIRSTMPMMEAFSLEGGMRRYLLHVEHNHSSMT
jgi:sulfur-carrier protein adenylyltransferase/sulfurtransferase